MNSQILPRVLNALSSPQTNIRAAACQCTRSLSRSVKNLRTSLIDAGIVTPLLKLLSDPSITVKTAACATVCNIVLDFSPMKKTFIENGGIVALVQMVHDSTDENLKLNALWALKNILFQADPDIKTNVFLHLGASTIKALCEDPSFAIQEQALNLLRNAACGREADILFVLNQMGESTIIDILEQKLCLVGIPDEMHLHALYMIVNIATGKEAHKSLIMNSATIISNIVRLLVSPKSQIRIAAVWCIINLTWPDDVGSRERIEVFKALRVAETLLDLVERDTSMDVKERVKTALVNFGHGPHCSATENSDELIAIEPVRTDRRSDGLHFGTVIYDDENSDMMITDPTSN